MNADKSQEPRLAPGKPSPFAFIRVHPRKSAARMPLYDPPAATDRYSRQRLRKARLVR